MKKINKVLSMAMVGVLTLGGLVQPVQASRPDHYPYCDCGSCQFYDRYIKEDMDTYTNAVMDAYVDYLDTPKPGNYHDPSSKYYIAPDKERYIPGEQKYVRPINDVVSKYFHPMQQVYIDDGWTSNLVVFWSAFNAIYDNRGFAEKLPSWDFGPYAHSVLGCERLFEDNGLYTKTVEMKDMMHIYEALKTSESMAVILDIDTAFYSEDSLQFVKDNSRDIKFDGTVHTVMIIGTQLIDDTIVFNMYDPFMNNLLQISQKELRKVTIGAGLDQMLLVDTNQ